MLLWCSLQEGPLQAGRRPGSCVEESRKATPLDAETNLRMLLKRHRKQHWFSALTEILLCCWTGRGHQ